MLLSWLFVPGSQDRRLAKAKEFSADALIYDLEDAVAISEKESARTKVAQSIQETKEKVNFVRVNALSSHFFLDDIEQVVGQGLAGIVLPKVNNVKDIIIAEYLLVQLERKRQLPPSSLSIVPIIETAIGLQNAYDIATASPKVTRLAFGAADFTLDINTKPTDDGAEILYARSKLVTASRAANIAPPIDSVYTNFKDQKGLLRDTQLGKRLGFQGKLLIHPEQIETINQVFAPTTDEVAEAKAIVAAYQESVSSGEGAIQINGEMVDYPIVERAKMILSQAGEGN